MRKSRFTEAQIIGMIKERGAGLPAFRCRSKDGLARRPAGSGMAGCGPMENQGASAVITAQVHKPGHTEMGR